MATTTMPAPSCSARVRSRGCTLGGTTCREACGCRISHSRARRSVSAMPCPANARDATSLSSATAMPRIAAPSSRHATARALICPRGELAGRLALALALVVAAARQEGVSSVQADGESVERLSPTTFRAGQDCAECRGTSPSSTSAWGANGERSSRGVGRRSKVWICGGASPAQAVVHEREDRSSRRVAGGRRRGRR